MTSRVTAAFSNLQAKSFLNYLINNKDKDSFYVFTSDPVPVNGDPNNDLTPPNPEINQERAKNMVYSNALTATKILPGSVSRVTRRFDWAIGEIFVPYTTSINPLTHQEKYYCIVEKNDSISGIRKLDVYKCLYTPTDENGQYLPVGWNNIASGRYKPSSDQNNPVDMTDDFYYWNYMYTITPYQEAAFLSSVFMPIPETPEKSEYHDLVEGTQRYDLRISAETAIKGSIYNISIKNPGALLNDGLYNLSVFDGGTENSVTTPYYGKMLIENGMVKKIDLKVPGHGYTGNAIVDIPRECFKSETSTLPVLIADISSSTGHGSDPVQELGGNYVMVNARKYFSEAERGTVTRNDFRTLSIVRNPIDESTGDIAQGDYYDLTYKMKFGYGIEGVYEDSYIVRTQTEQDNSLKTALVVGVGNKPGEKDGTLLSVIPKGADYGNGIFDLSKDHATGESYRLKTSLNQAVLSSDFLLEYTKPLIKRFSGEIIQLEHRKPLNRTEGQIEVYSFTFSF